MSASDKAAIDRLLDASVFAPLGYVLRRGEVREDLAAVGRKQVAFARSLGRAALRNVGRGVASRGTVEQPASTAAQAEPVPGYGDMTAKQIVTFLRSANRGQAEWIVQQESAGKQRVTVLRPATAMLEVHD